MPELDLPRVSKLVCRPGGWAPWGVGTLPQVCQGRAHPRLSVDRVHMQRLHRVPCNPLLSEL